MLRWTGADQVPDGWGPSAVAVGVFDGVHRGHAHVVRRAVEHAQADGMRSVVVTFDPNPVAVLRPDRAPARLSTLEHRLDLLTDLDVEATLVLPFTRELAAEPAESFVERVLVGALGVGAVVVGEDFRFGARAAGDVALLARLGEEHGFVVDPLAPVGTAGQRWSSSRVRTLVAEGDVAAAAEVLGRWHRVEGTVVRGDARGRDLGYPTANLGGTEGSAVPADGVYAGLLRAAPHGDPLPAAVSIGTNPTFDGSERRVEAYVLDRDDLELYGAHVAVDFVARLRPTLRFDDVDALVRQMDADVAATRGVLAALPSGGARPRW